MRRSKGAGLCMVVVIEGGGGGDILVGGWVLNGRDIVGGVEGVGVTKDEDEWKERWGCRYRYAAAAAAAVVVAIDRW